MIQAEGIFVTGGGLEDVTVAIVDLSLADSVIIRSGVQDTAYRIVRGV